MTCRKSPCLWVGLLCCVCGLAALCASIATDYWSVYRVPNELRPNLTDWQIRDRHFGLWKICYDNQVPTSIDTNDLIGADKNCIHWTLIRSSEHKLPSEERRDLHIRRSVVGTACTSGIIQIITLIILLLGRCPRGPCGCKRVKSNKIYLAAAICAMLAGVFAMTAGTMFMVQRGEEVLPVGMRHTYSWSFMLCWISAGLCVTQGFLFASLWGYSDDGSLDLKKQLLAY